MLYYCVTVEDVTYNLKKNEQRFTLTEQSRLGYPNQDIYRSDA